MLRWPVSDDSKGEGTMRREHLETLLPGVSWREAERSSENVFFRFEVSPSSADERRQGRDEGFVQKPSARGSSFSISIGRGREL